MAFVPFLPVFVLASLAVGGLVVGRRGGDR
jgi:hypothetical protein